MPGRPGGYASDMAKESASETAGTPLARLGITHIDPNMRIVAEVGAVTRQWQAAMDAELRDHGLTYVRWHTLWRIAESDTLLNQTDLARRVGIESSTLVRQLDALEALGLIERIVDTDRRARRIRLTSAASPVIRTVIDLAVRMGGEILGDLDQTTVAQCASVLHLMSERLRDRTPPGEGGLD